MSNKTLAALFTGFLLVLSLPSAGAADLPVLTWEKGKEHNIVLGGNGIVKDWKIQLKGAGNSPLTFTKSRVDSRGYVVFSVFVPENYPSGIFTVVTNSSQDSTNVVAGVRIVEISDFNLIQIPTKLYTILFTLVILISTLSILRMQKYEKIEYIRAKLAPAPEGVIGNLYRFRASAIEEIHRSIFKFQLIREGELLHKFSPAAWAIVPWLSVAAGAAVSLGESQSAGMSLTPALLYFAMALVGVIDPFSGFMASLGFSIAHAMSGDISSVRALMSLAALSAGCFAPGLVSSLYSDAFNKDAYPTYLKRFLPDLLASFIGGLIFMSAQFLTNSFAEQPASISAGGYILPLAFTLLIYLRIKGEKWINKDLHQTGENYQFRILVLPRVISPRTMIFSAFYLTGAFFVWTNSWEFALKTSAMYLVPMILSMVRFENPVITPLRKFQRHIFIEVSILLALTYWVFSYIQSLPIEVTQKGRLLVCYTAVLLLIHGFYSSIFDSSHREKKISELELAA